MGLFSGIAKAFKSVFKGIAKIFSPILKPLAKLLNSSLGKAIMIGLSIFTLGSAMIAGAGQFATTMGSTGSFIQSFVEGGKVFLTTLTGMGGKEAAGSTAGSTTEALAQGAASAGDASQIALQAGGPQALVEGAGAGALEGANQIVQGGNQAVQAAGEMVSGAGASGGSGLLSQGAAAAGPTKELAAAGGSLATRAAPGAAESGNWLSKAAKAAGDFAKSEGGGQIVGSLIQGAGNYYAEKDRQEFEDRVRRDWMSGDRSSGVRNVRAQSARVGGLEAPSASGIASAARDTANQDQRRPTFDRTYGAQPQPAGG